MNERYARMRLVIVEVPIPDQDPVGNLEGTKISITLGLNSNQVGTKSQLN